MYRLQLFEGMDKLALTHKPKYYTTTKEVAAPLLCTPPVAALKTVVSVGSLRVSLLACRLAIARCSYRQHTLAIILSSSLSVKHAAHVAHGQCLRFAGCQHMTTAVSGVVTVTASGCECCHTARQSGQHVVMTAIRYQSSCTPNYVAPS